MTLSTLQPGRRAAGDLPTHPTLIHPLTGQPLRAIGFSRRGPIWPAIGGDGTDPADPPADPAKPADPPKDEPLGDGGKKALDEERKARKAAEAEAAKLRKADEDRKLADKSELEQAQARQAKAEQAAAAATARAVRAEVKAAATGWADPADAPRYLDDLATYVDAGGNVDTDAIEKALAAVLEAKPHLAKSTGATAARKPKPDPAQGARPGDKASSLDGGRSLYAERHKKKSPSTT